MNGFPELPEFQVNLFGGDQVWELRERDIHTKHKKMKKYTFFNFSSSI